MAPATLKRSVIVVFIEALSFIRSRLTPASLRPIFRSKATKPGTTTSEARVTCQDSTSMTPRVVTSPSRSATTLDSVPTVCCAPSTSLERRLMSDPVWVRVKKSTGMRCTCP